MTNPTPERIDAALRLAKAVEKAFPAAIAQQSDWCAESKEVVQALAAYRATAPKLRTRAEVDAELVALMRDRCGRGGTLEEDQQLWIRFNELCREPLAPEPTETGDAELRSRLRNIYSLTHTYGTDPMAALLAIREACSPGA